MRINECSFVHTFVCLCVRTFVCLCVCLYVYLCVGVLVFLCIGVFACSYVCVFLCFYVCLLVCLCVLLFRNQIICLYSFWQILSQKFFCVFSSLPFYSDRYRIMPRHGIQVDLAHILGTWYPTGDKLKVVWSEFSYKLHAKLQQGTLTEREEWVWLTSSLRQPFM
jgi:hypothetical protein